eukprot:scaffold529_cov308-Pinguiococcus_pyrenoidosus.AAC.38
MARPLTLKWKPADRASPVASSYPKPFGREHARKYFGYKLILGRTFAGIHLQIVRRSAIDVHGACTLRVVVTRYPLDGHKLFHVQLCVRGPEHRAGNPLVLATHRGPGLRLGALCRKGAAWLQIRMPWLLRSSHSITCQRGLSEEQRGDGEDATAASAAWWARLTWNRHAVDEVRWWHSKFRTLVTASKQRSSLRRPCARPSS